MALKGMKRPETAEEVIARLTERSGDCWRWLGSHSRGYAKMRWYEGTRRRNARVARVAYEMTRGPIPDGLEIDHLCRNRWCVNPSHFELVTRKENMERYGAHVIATRRFCEKHPDVLLNCEGRVRVCRICKRAYLNEWRARRKTATVKGK